MTTDIMQAYVTEYLQYKNVNMWADCFAIRNDYRNGYRATAGAKYRLFCDTWKNKHPEFGTAQSWLKEMFQEGES